MSDSPNPYIAGDPVGKTTFFVGRKDVLYEVERMLRHPTQNAITLYGQRRIGKTSILQYLEAHLPGTGLYYPIYFDLMHKTGMSLRKILCDLARTIYLKLNLSDHSFKNINEKTFRENYLPDALAELPESGSLVLLLDEFDVLADPQARHQVKRQFFSYLNDLRHLDQVHLKFVFVLGRNIDDLDVIAQGLFKDLPSKRVSLLSQRDAETLVRLSEYQGGLNWTQDAITRVWELTSGHPYLTQALCSQVWEDSRMVTKIHKPVQPDDVENAVLSTLDRSQNMFAWLWGGLGPAEKVVAAAFAGTKSETIDEERLNLVLSESGVRILIGELKDAPRILQKWDILIPADGGYRFRVELLRRWIAEKKPLSRTQEELDYINPVANSLFEAARGYYMGRNLNQAESLLRQALGLNPNHIRATELLAEILLGKNNLDEAQQLLERLEKIAPEKARRRLKQVYLQRAELEVGIDHKLDWYKKILTRIPEDLQANRALRQIYPIVGQKALQSGNFRAALNAFREIGDTENIKKTEALILQQEDDPESRWLRDVGLKENPFRHWDAEEMDPYLPDYFSRSIELQQVTTSQLTRERKIWFFGGDEGSGKTALRRFLATKGRPTTWNADMICFEVDQREFERLISQLDEISNFRNLFFRTMVEKCIQIFQDESLNTPLTWHSDERVQENIAALSAWLRERGVDWVLCLVDPSREFITWKGSQVPTASLLESLITFPQSGGIGLRFILPTYVKDELKKRSSFNIGNQHRYMQIKWDEASLVKLIAKRMTILSVDQSAPFRSLGQICEQELDRLVDAEIASMAQGSPRAAIWLANRLVEVHCQEVSKPPVLISQQDWNAVKAAWWEGGERLILGETKPNKFLVLEERIFYRGHEIVLSKNSHLLFYCLTSARDGFCSNDELIQARWPGEKPTSITEKSLSEAIRRMKNELITQLKSYGEDVSGSKWVKSVRKRGYRLEYPGITNQDGDGA